jgi:hypothetical protein
LLAPSPSQQEWPPHGLISLWDIMQLFDAGQWTATISYLHKSISLAEGRHDQPVDRKFFVDLYEALAKRCSDNGLRVCADLSQMHLHLFKAEDLVMRGVDAKKNLETVQDAMFSELRTMIFLRVRYEYSKFLEDKQLFGAEVADKFPSAIRDIEAAGKCVAYEMGTATVFHLMRIMEVGLKCLAKPLGIPYAPSWESYLKQIETKITAKHKSKGVKWKRDETFFRDILGSLQMIKIAWRNPTMHIVRSYAPEEAEEIFRAVRTFMKQLAEKFSEVKVSV